MIDIEPEHNNVTDVIDIYFLKDGEVSKIIKERKYLYYFKKGDLYFNTFINVLAIKNISFDNYVNNHTEKYPFMLEIKYNADFNTGYFDRDVLRTYNQKSKNIITIIRNYKSYEDIHEEIECIEKQRNGIFIDIENEYHRIFH